jgi:hypothetical protein
MAFIDDATRRGKGRAARAIACLLERKLTEAGIPMPPETIDACAEHLLSGKGGGFVWDSGDDDWEVESLRAHAKLTFPNPPWGAAEDSSLSAQGSAAATSPQPSRHRRHSPA